MWKSWQEHHLTVSVCVVVNVAVLVVGYAVVCCWLLGLAQYISRW